MPSGSSSWTQRQAGKKDITRKFEVKMETAKVLCHIEVDKICLKKKFCSFPPKSCFGLSWFGFFSPPLSKLKLLCLQTVGPMMNIVLSCHPLCLLLLFQVIACSQSSIKLQPGANQHIAQGCPHLFSRLYFKEKCALRKVLLMPHSFVSLSGAKLPLFIVLKISF